MRLFLAVLIIWAATGCAYQTAQLSLVSPDPNLLPVDILARNVEGRWCPPFGDVRPQYDRAVALALDSVPGATVLVNASFQLDTHYSSPQGIKECTVVRGDAGRLR